MFEVDEEKTIHVTRGNVGSIEIGAEDENGEEYVFKVGDVIRFKVLRKNNCNVVELEKNITVNEEGKTRVNISFTKEETKIGELISKYKDYWYEVELNPETEPKTIIGYDKDGAKIFRLYPEGGDKNGDTNR